MSNTLDRSANQLMRALRGDLSPGEFAASVRRAAREIGEHVSCDARYVGRIESGGLMRVHHLTCAPCGFEQRASKTPSRTPHGAPRNGR